MLWVQVCCSYQQQSTIIQHLLQMVDSEWAWGEGIFGTACMFWDASWIAPSTECALSQSALLNISRSVAVMEPYELVHRG